MIRDTLFIKKDFIMHSGDKGTYKIECDSLTDEDIETLAWIISQKIYQSSNGDRIRKVYGVPRGGVKIATALEKYIDSSGTIDVIVDDVLTTGNSLIEAKEILQWENPTGIVIFARGKCPSWVIPIFDMYEFYSIK